MTVVTPSALNGALFRYRPVTVHGLSPYPPYDLIHVELQLPIAPTSQEEKDILFDALKHFLGEYDYERIWTVSFQTIPSNEANQGLPIVQLGVILENDYF